MEQGDKNIKESKPLGERLVEERLITKEQLKRALRIQQQNPEMLIGKILVDQGFITQEKFEEFLSRTIRLKQPLGEKLIKLGYINESQLKSALEVQTQLSPHQYKPLGRILYDLGYVTLSQIRSVLKIPTGYTTELTLSEKPIKEKERKITEFTPDQINDIQGIISVADILLKMLEKIFPKENILKERYKEFYKIMDFKEPYNLPVKKNLMLQHIINDLVINFLPILQFNIKDNINDTFSRAFSLVIHSFAEMWGLNKNLNLRFNENSFLLDGKNKIILLREALFIIAKGNIKHHPSILSLRFLLNDFWGTKSLLKESGIEINRPDEIDLTDFFSAKTGSPQRDLELLYKAVDQIIPKLEKYIDNIVQILGGELTPEIIDEMQNIMEYLNVLIQIEQAIKELHLEIESLNQEE